MKTGKSPIHTVEAGEVRRLLGVLLGVILVELIATEHNKVGLDRTGAERNQGHEADEENDRVVEARDGGSRHNGTTDDVDEERDHQRLQRAAGNSKQFEGAVSESSRAVPDRRALARAQSMAHLRLRGIGGPSRFQDSRPRQSRTHAQYLVATQRGVGQVGTDERYEVQDRLESRLSS